MSKSCSVLWGTALILLCAGCALEGPVVYRIAYNTNGGSGVMEDSFHTHGLVKNLNPNGFSREGYVFAGWAASPEGPVVYTDQAPVLDVSDPGAVFTLYAVWKVITYRIVYNANGGDGSMDNSFFTYGVSQYLPSNTFIRAGYFFTGWATTTTGAVQYGDGQSVSNLSTIAEATVTLYAVWMSTTPEMVKVAGGTFTMGSPTTEQERDNDETQHTVTLNDFYMGKYEVTQGLYRAVMGSNPSFFTGNDNLPVEQVSWYDAVEFCNKLSLREERTPVYTITGAVVTMDMSKNGYRLPTEAEWEYAARGGSIAPEYYVYAGSNTAGDVAWYSVNSENRTHEAGTKTFNALGLYDMSGNVYEWCWDWYGTYPSDSRTNPTGASSGSYRVSRGGSWSLYNERYLRTAYRNSITPSSRLNNQGFRLARL